MQWLVAAGLRAIESRSNRKRDAELQAMKHFRYISYLVLFFFTIQHADAGGGGKLLSLLLARTAVRAATNTVKTYPSNVMTVGQLAVCLTSARTLDEESQAVDQAKQDFEKLSKRIDDKSRELDARGSSLDRTNKFAVNAYNEDVRAYNLLLRSGKDIQQQSNARIVAYNAKVSDYNGSCGAKQYYPDDLEAAKKIAGIQ
jgi:hypothetical protein